jgi:transposase
MKDILKQCVGIDCSKDELVCCLSFLEKDMSITLVSAKSFPNSKTGFHRILSWVKKHSLSTFPVKFVVEATGVYHERLAEYFYDRESDISVVLPRRVSLFAKSLQTKTITDETASEAISQFGLLKKLDKWQKPDKVYRFLRNLTREREQLLQQRTIAKNQLHAEQSGAWANKNTIKRLKGRISFFNKQIQQIEQEIAQVVKDCDELKHRLDYAQSKKGVSLITAVTVIAETDGFNLIRNCRQLVSYAGLDVIEKQSGTSVRKKPRISRRGNRHIRRALYMPALSAIRYDKLNREHYERLVDKHGIKMKAIVSVQRKLLVLIYTLWKNQTSYDPIKYSSADKKSGNPKLDSPTELDLVCSHNDTKLT